MLKEANIAPVITLISLRYFFVHILLSMKTFLFPYFLKDKIN